MATPNDYLMWGATTAVIIVIICRFHSPHLYITSLFCFYPILNKARQVLSVVDLPILITPLTVCLLVGLLDAKRGILLVSKHARCRPILLLPLSSLLPILHVFGTNPWSPFVFFRGYFQFLEAMLVFFILYSVLEGRKIATTKVWIIWITSSCLFAFVELIVNYGTTAAEILLSGGLRDGDKSAVSAGFYEILVFANILVFFVGYYWQSKYVVSAFCFFVILLSQTRAAILYGTTLIIAASALSINKGATRRVVILFLLAAPLLVTFALERFSSQLSSGEIQLVNGPSIGHSTAIKGLILIEASERALNNPFGDYVFQPEVDVANINEISFSRIIFSIVFSPITNFSGYGIFTLALITCVYYATAIHLKRDKTLLLSFIAFIYASAFTSNVAFWSNIEISTANSTTLPQANITSFDIDGKYFVHHNDGVFWIFTILAICLTTQSIKPTPQCSYQKLNQP